jgi:O-antigen/teichoic acid export membrane protein
MIISIPESKALFVKYNTYFKNTFLYLFSSLFASVLGIIINPFLAKNLSPNDYAIMGYFGSFNIIISPILNFSLITYYIRNYYLIPEERRRIVSDTILIALLVYGFIALIVVCTIFYYYWKWYKISFPFYPFALLAIAPNFLNNFLILFQGKCRLEREAGKYSKITIFSTLLNIIFAIFLVIIFKYGASGRLLATLVASVIISIYCFIQLFGKLQFDFSVIKEAFRFGWPLSISAILWYFFNGVDAAMLEKLHDSYTYGFYNVGMQIAGYFAVFYIAISQTFEPDIYKAIASNEKRKLAKILIGIISLNAIPNILFIIFAPLIIGLLTYNRYTNSSSFAQIFALKNITLSFYYTALTVIVGYGFTKSDLLLRFFGAILCIIMFKILISGYGFYGAAWGQVFSFVIMASITIVFLRFKIKYI